MASRLPPQPAVVDLHLLVSLVAILAKAGVHLNDWVYRCCPHRVDCRAIRLEAVRRGAR